MITIVGARGCGASLLAGAFNELGADLGAEQGSLAYTPGDPGGHFEHVPVLNLNRDLLIALGGTWSTPPPLPKGWVEDERIALLRHRAEQIARETPERRIVMDSRLSLVQPLWQDVGAVPATILCLRHPVAAARWLEARHQLTLDQGLFLWFRYNAAAGVNRPDAMVVEFESVMASPESELTRIADHLELKVDSKLIDAAARTVLLARAEPGSDNLGDSPIGFVCSRLYDLIRSGDSLESDEMVWTWARLVTELPWAGPGDPDIIRARREVTELGFQVRRLSRENKVRRRRVGRLEDQLQQALLKIDELTIAQTRYLLDAMEGGRR